MRVIKIQKHQPIFYCSTWQSIFKLPKQWFQQFDVVIGDEAHLFKAKSLTSILTKLNQCKYRFGFTGTLDGTQTHKLVLEGLFGPVRKITTTAELMEQKHLAELMIKALVLKYPDDIRKLMTGVDYQAEMDFLVKHTPRNKFIKNLALSLTGNTLLLFQYVDKHGKVLFDMISQEVVDRKVFFISGSVDGEKREEIRKIVDSNVPEIVLDFDFGSIKIPSNALVLLETGETVEASQLTTESDISNEWLSRTKEKYKYP